MQSATPPSPRHHGWVDDPDAEDPDAEDPDAEDPDAVEEQVEWWLWRMSDGTLLPIATDETGTDWPCLGDGRERALAVDALLRSNAEVRSDPPTAVDVALLLRHTIGWSAAAAMLVSAAVALAAPLPDLVNAIGGFGFLLAPIAVSDLVSRRRIRALPPDLQAVAQAAVHRYVSQVGPVRWRWIGKRVVAALGLLMLLALIFLR